MKKLHKNYIKYFREKSGLTLQQVEDKMKEVAIMHGLEKHAVSYVQIARHEKGSTPPDQAQLEIYGMIFNTTLGALLIGPEKNNEILDELRVIMSGLSDSQQKTYVDMLKLFAKKDDE